jgi:hypothetical protein
VNINPDDVLPDEARVRELEQINLVMQLAQAQQAQSQAQNAAAQGAGAPPEISQPPAAGSVAERRNAA